MLTTLCSLIACSQTRYFLLKGPSSARSTNGVGVGKEVNRRVRSCHGMDLINIFSPKDVHSTDVLSFSSSNSALALVFAIDVEKKKKTTSVYRLAV